jgi:hypothetical protein
VDYTLLITTPDTGRNVITCATMTDVQNQIVHFIRHSNTENNYIIEVVFNVN